MSIKRNKTTKSKIGFKPQAQRSASLSGLPAEIVRESIAKLKTLHDNPSASSIYDSFNMVFENTILDVAESSKMSEHEKWKLKSYRCFLELLQNDLAVALSQIDDVRLIRAIVSAVSGIKFASAAIGTFDVDRMSDFVIREIMKPKGPDLNKAKLRKNKPKRERRREIIEKMCAGQEISSPWKFAQSIEPEVNAELAKRGMKEVSVTTIYRDVDSILNGVERR